MKWRCQLFEKLLITILVVVSKDPKYSSALNEIWIFQVFYSVKLSENRLTLQILRCMIDTTYFTFTTMQFIKLARELSRTSRIFTNASTKGTTTNKYNMLQGFHHDLTSTHKFPWYFQSIIIKKQCFFVLVDIWETPCQYFFC